MSLKTSLLCALCTLLAMAPALLACNAGTGKEGSDSATEDSGQTGSNDTATVDEGADTVALDAADSSTADSGDTTSPEDTKAVDALDLQDSGESHQGETDQAETDLSQQGLASCVERTPPTRSPTGFRHTGSQILVALSDPEHSAQDVIGTGPTFQIPGKFAYGTINKDLEDEDIELYLDDCSGWNLVTTATTDSDGRSSSSLDAVEAGLDNGVYDLHQIVLGDASSVPSRLRILPPGTRLVVLDIDGTLSTSDGELAQDIFAEFYEPLFGGDFVPEAYPGAVELTRAWSDKGYILVYMTGRPYYLTRITRDWLDELDFAPAHLHVTDSNAEALPTESGVGSYKRDYLLLLQSLGYVIEYAYGNAGTDIFAYAEAGIPLDHTFIIGDNAGEDGTQPIEGGYLEHLDLVATLPSAQQPF